MGSDVVIKDVDEAAYRNLKGEAVKAGLKVGDIVMKVNDQEIKGYDAFRQNVSKAGPGAGLTLHIKRDEKEMSLGVTVEARGRRGRRAP